MSKKMTLATLALTTFLATSGAVAAEPATTQEPARQTLGRQIMTQDERNEQRARMREATTQEARDRVRSEHHEAMKERAKERGATLPDTPPGRGQGGGMSGGGMGGGGRGGR
jgi:Ni/Co efflux regulator RcnB